MRRRNSWGGAKIRKLGRGATQFFFGIPQFHFHFSIVDFLLCEDDSLLLYKTAQ